MFCTYCGQEIDASATLCPACGKPTSEPTVQTTQIEENPVLRLFSQVCSSKDFFTATVLYTISAAVVFLGSFLSGGTATLPIFNIITFIALFLLRSRANNCAPLDGFLGPTKALKFVNGFIYVFGWIAAVILAVSGGILVALGGSSAKFGLSFSDIFKISGVEAAAFGDLASLFSDSVSVFFIVMGIIFLVVAVFLVLITIFVYGRLKKLLNAAVLALQSGVFGEIDFEIGRKALILHAIVLILSFLSSAISILSISGVVSLASSALSVASIIIFAKILGNIKKQ